MRVFLDTNVVVSALATRGLAADVFRAVLAEHTLVTGDIVLEELDRVLAKKLRLPGTVIRDVLSLLKEGEVVPRPAEKRQVKVRDEDDAWILATAVAGNADVLVTGDRDLLAIAERSPVHIVDPRGFWEMLRQGAGP